MPILGVKFVSVQQVNDQIVSNAVGVIIVYSLNTIQLGSGDPYSVVIVDGTITATRNAGSIS